MKNGYYLSAYLHIDPLAFLYEISLRHDQTAALWRVDDGAVELVRYWELERKTGRKKHALSFFSVEQCRQVLNELLGEVSLSLEDVEEIWGTPGLEKAGASVSSYDENDPCPYHSLCHLFSGVASDTDAMRSGPTLAFALDGGPDNVVDRTARSKSFYWGLFLREGQASYFPVPSPGAFWSLLRLKSGLEEGSLMALGSAATARLPAAETLTAQAPSVFRGEHFTEADQWIDEILQAARTLPKDEITDYDPRFREEENRLSMAVKIVQSASVEILRKNTEQAIQTYGIDPEVTRLVMTGGFALNCPTNSFLMNTFAFRSFDTCPCVSDTGIALGIGLYEFYRRLPGFSFRLNSAYHGSLETRSPLSLSDTEWAPFIASAHPFEPEVFAEDLEKTVVVWFEGQAEIGPRALGARSILGSPSSQAVKDRLNEVKLRQWWRPVAPIILEDRQDEWFCESFSSQYMLCTCQARERHISEMTAILHLDNSARIQSMRRDSDTLLRRGVEAFERKTGIPIICNTSLNDKGEPIIDSFEQCLNFALRKGIEIAYLNGVRLQLQNSGQYTAQKPYPRRADWFAMDDAQRARYQAEYNPGGFTAAEIDLYLNFPELSGLDIRKEADIKRLRRMLRQWKRLSQTVWAAMLL